MGKGEGKATSRGCVMVLCRSTLYRWGYLVDSREMFERKQSLIKRFEGE